MGSARGGPHASWRTAWKLALGTAAAPMIFELPFDLIVMARTNPPIPTHPMLYRQLFFLPLFLVEFSTVSLLTLLPSMRVTAYACYAVAGMFAVFAIWAASFRKSCASSRRSCCLPEGRATKPLELVQDDRIQSTATSSADPVLSPPLSRRSAPCSRGSA